MSACRRSTEARIGAIGLTPAAPEAGDRVTSAGAGAAELLDDVAPAAAEARRGRLSGWSRSTACPVIWWPYKRRAANDCDRRRPPRTELRQPPRPPKPQRPTRTAQAVLL